MQIALRHPLSPAGQTSSRNIDYFLSVELLTALNTRGRLETYVSQPGRRMSSPLALNVIFNCVVNLETRSARPSLVLSVDSSCGTDITSKRLQCASACHSSSCYVRNIIVCLYAMSQWAAQRQLYDSNTLLEDIWLNA